MRLESDHSLLVDLARPMVERFSPGEGELFPLLSAAYFADPGAYADPSQRSGPLAFGLPEALVLLTPVALAAMTEAVRYVVEVGVRKGHRVTSATLRRMFRAAPQQAVAPAAEAAAPLELTGQEWSEVRRIVERVAVRGGVEPDRAALIADAVVGQGRLSGEIH
ncbi:hypothetical protein O7614_19750 [Micromonospora sp. WMMD961]|uniref:hypothetical protein n=1 Tax=Micromonospora sp. WMMD961 TaxID=3016100 RepID=UPI00241700F0|nr:hypothetical protein [Micromonospora sp. WMMD961]MDG4781895.1 hypothetical protein [Micromonospora sp. WMMD961]